jgi:hypothetical protein
LKPANKQHWRRSRLSRRSGRGHGEGREAGHGRDGQRRDLHRGRRGRSVILTDGQGNEAKVITTDIVG